MICGLIGLLRVNFGLGFDGIMDKEGKKERKEEKGRYNLLYDVTCGTHQRSR